MGNCLVAQSGGPTPVINSTLAGIIAGNNEIKLYDKVYGGLNGIEGVLEERFVELDYDSTENMLLKQTPAAILGSCRYKLEADNEEKLAKVFEILDKYDIETFFYIGGNDSMDTVDKLKQYAEKMGRNKRFIGCPKTVDNDLVGTDHCPGYGSSAKMIATSVLSTSQDFHVYTRKDVFILETMGRDTGWLAASACLAKTPDIVILPETPFYKEKFLSEVERCLSSKNKCYIVTAEGAKYDDGKYIATSDCEFRDGFNHVPLSGGKTAHLLRSFVLNEVSPSCKVQDMGFLQRCFSPFASKTDVEEAFQVGRVAVLMSEDTNFTGKMIAMERCAREEYEISFKSVDVGIVANSVKHFPKEWIHEDYKGVTDEAINYMSPLIQGDLDIKYEKGIPIFLKSYATSN